VNYKIYIDPAALSDTLLNGDPEHRIGPIEIKHMPDICEYSPYEHSKFDAIVKTQDWVIYYYVVTLQSSCNTVNPLIKRCIMCLLARLPPLRRLFA
jgi:hypothetical protein